ncbi:MAG: SGNH/GDSL hydrolase family protein [Thermodesulfobacteriota bacterium]
MFAALASAVGFVLFLIVLEMSLYAASKIFPDGLDMEGHWRKNKEINEANAAQAQKNPFRFNDRVRLPEKPPGIRYRVVVLGDSFIWGDGLPPGRSWNRKLEKRIMAAAPWVEVLSWGKCGWSTKDELAFLKEHGKEYGVDLVVLGWVDNDPDLGDHQQKYLTWQDHMGPVKALFPRALALFSQRLNRLLYDRVLHDYGYFNWRDKLYTPENLERYQKVLGDLAAYCRQSGTALLVCMTPDECGESLFRANSLIIPLMKQSGIRVLDLLPEVCRRYGDRPLKELHASPVNGHPGELLTDLFAEEVFRFLRSDPAYAALLQGESAP